MTQSRCTCLLLFLLLVSHSFASSYNSIYSDEDNEEVQQTTQIEFEDNMVITKNQQSELKRTFQPIDFEIPFAPPSSQYSVLFMVIACVSSISLIILLLFRRCTGERKENTVSRNESFQVQSHEPNGSEDIPNPIDADLMPSSGVCTDIQGSKEQFIEKIERASREQAREDKIPTQVIQVRQQLEQDLLKPLLSRNPAIELRSRLKICAALLKAVAQEERMSMPDKLVKLFGWSLLSMSVAFLLSLFALLGDNAPFTAFDPSTFFSGSGSIWSILSSLLVPFGWNMASIIPYVMAVTSISQFSSMIPFVGPFIQRALLLVLFGRFFWQLRVSLLTMFICNIGLTAVGWGTIRLRWNRRYSRILCISLAIPVGIGIAYIEPSVAYVRSPFISFCVFLRLCDEYYL